MEQRAGRHLDREPCNAAVATQAQPKSSILQEVEAPPEPSGRVPTGKVVYIAKRNWRSRGYAGSLKPSENITPGRTASVLFAPVERKFPYIRVRTHQAEALMSKRIVVAVDEWPADSQYPLGHYTGIIGTIGEAQTEGEVRRAPDAHCARFVGSLVLRGCCLGLLVPDRLGHSAKAYIYAISANVH